MVKTVFIGSITSDIGTALARMFSEDGWDVIGTYRNSSNLTEIKNYSKFLFYCDLSDPKTTSEVSKEFSDKGLSWDLFISCFGTQKPIGPFFKTDFDAWSDSIHVNAIEQLRLLHSLYNFRRGSATVIFFAGGGTNNAVKNYSAYTASKIMLIKMTELIDFENEDINISIIGPGWTRSKMHNETLETDRNLVGKNWETTKNFMESGAGTPMEDIYGCIRFILRNPEETTGRNFSVVHDDWRKEHKNYLLEALGSNYDMYKIRRFMNDFGKRKAV